MLLVDAVRESCARVAGAARFVEIDESALAACARRLPLERASLHEAEPSPPAETAEQRAAFALILAAINFGSGWWPTIRKRPGLSGYLTIARALAEWFGSGRSTRELAALRPADVATILGQDPTHELMELYTANLRDVGHRIELGFGGSFAALVEAADASAPRLVEILAAWPSFLDVSVYRGRPVPFFKRAQFAAASLAGAGAKPLRDLEHLTLFADNLVPHVLRVDGVLRYDADLAARIDREELLDHGSPEEIEIRACAVEATERIAGLRSVAPMTVDRVLWNLGQDPRFKSRPRHRSRCTAY